MCAAKNYIYVAEMYIYAAKSHICAARSYMCGLKSYMCGEKCYMCTVSYISAALSLYVRLQFLYISITKACYLCADNKSANGHPYTLAWAAFRISSSQVSRALSLGA